MAPMWFCRDGVALNAETSDGLEMTLDETTAVVGGYPVVFLGASPPTISPGKRPMVERHVVIRLLEGEGTTEDRLRAYRREKGAGAPGVRKSRSGRA